MQTTLIATVKGAKPQFTDAQKKMLNDAFRALEGMEVSITISKPKKIRSNSQNAYYWGVVLKTICDANGDVDKDLNTHFKKEFAPRKVVKVMGIEKVEPKDTHEMTTTEFEAFMERIRAVVAEALSINIPLPNEG